MDILQKKQVLFEVDVKSRDELFAKIAELAVQEKFVEQKDVLVKGFQDREDLDSTAFEDGFAIPHARTSDVKKAGAFFVRLKNPIVWDKDGKTVDCAIMLIIPESNGDYLDILSGIATKLMDQKNRELLKTTTDANAVVKLLMEKQQQKESVVAKNKNALKIVGISACATGVVHTYMARDAILKAGEKLNWTVAVETQGQKGQEFALTSQEIEEADAVILAVDIAVDLDRFAGKKIYKVGTKTLIEDPETQVRYAVSKGKVLSKEAAASGGGAFDIKNGKAWIQHIMSGISFMIPFIVFAGIIFAVVTGIGKIVYGTWMDYSGSLSDGVYVQHIKAMAEPSIRGGATIAAFDPIKDHAGWFDYSVQVKGAGIAILFYLNQFANIGFGVMIPIMGAYIANSIAGRSAIAPAFVLTSAGTTPAMWWKWGPFTSTVNNPLYDASNINTGEPTRIMSDLFPSNGGGIFAALLFGFVVGYTVKWINTKWRINKYIKPIMPIIIIPVFVSLFYGIITLFILGDIFGILVGYINLGLQKLEASQVGMAALGLVLGLIAGIDMGGPINKIASFGATALITVDNGHAMGCAAAAFAIAPLGAGICTQIFRKKFRDDQGLGVNATILGFMGISEGAIPFAAKYTWAAFIPNIVCSGIAGMLAGMFQVSGWVGAWGGPIIAIFGGVTSGDNMSYIGILWYFAAIIIAVAIHIVIFRTLVELKTDRGRVGSVKASHVEFVEKTNKTYSTKIKAIKDEMENLTNKRYEDLKAAKLAGNDVQVVKEKYSTLLQTKRSEIQALKGNLKEILAAEKTTYKAMMATERSQIKAHKQDISAFKAQAKQTLKSNNQTLKTQYQNEKQSTTNKLLIAEKRSELKNAITNNEAQYIDNVHSYIAKYNKDTFDAFNTKIKTLA
jgi:PTS system fructose-specific IIC component